MKKAEKQNAYDTLDTIIRKLERWQHRYFELDEENESGSAKSKLIDIWNKIRGSK